MTPESLGREFEMKVKELNKDQILILKQAYLTNVKYEDQGVSYDMLANADKLVSFEELEQEYGGVEFTEEDF